MSNEMNGIFLAFSQQDIDEMEQENSLILTFKDDEKYKFFADIEDAWYILPKMFDDIFSTGIHIKDEELPDNGCILFSTDNVNQATKELSKWTHESVLKAFQDIEKKEGLISIFESLRGDDGKKRLLQQFDKLIAFFKKAEEQSFGAVFIVE